MFLREWELNYSINRNHWTEIGAGVAHNLGHCQQQLNSGDKNFECLVEKFKQTLTEIEEELSHWPEQFPPTSKPQQGASGGS